MEAREGMVFDILVVADCGGLELGGLGCAREVERMGIWDWRRENRARSGLKGLIKGPSFGESKSTENRVMNQDLRQGP